MADDPQQKHGKAEGQKVKVAADQRKHSSMPRRSLFGSGRSEDTDEWLQGLEDKTVEEKVKKWNFDFREGKPLEDDPEVSNAPSPSHVYEAVDANEVPAFYRTKTITTETVSSVSVEVLKTPRKRRPARLAHVDEVDKCKQHSQSAQKEKAIERDKQEKTEEAASSSMTAAGSHEMASPRKRLRKPKSSDEKTPRKKTKLGEQEEET